MSFKNLWLQFYTNWLLFFLCVSITWLFIKVINCSLPSSILFFYGVYKYLSFPEASNSFTILLWLFFVIIIVIFFSLLFLLKCVVAANFHAFKCVYLIKFMPLKRSLWIMNIHYKVFISVWKFSLNFHHFGWSFNIVIFLSIGWKK